MTSIQITPQSKGMNLWRIQQFKQTRRMIQKVFFLNEVCHTVTLPQLCVTVRILPNKFVGVYFWIFVQIKSSCCWCINAFTHSYTQAPKIPGDSHINQFSSLQTITYGCANVVMWHTSFRKPLLKKRRITDVTIGFRMWPTSKPGKLDPVRSPIYSTGI